MFRYRKGAMRYKNAPKLKACAFCDDSQRAPTIAQTDHFWVIQNLFPYDIWEHHDVTEHYMIVPKRHVKSLNQLTSSERSAIIDTICYYEAQDFHIYARSGDSALRSIAAHQHTHLIKTSSHKVPRGSLYLEKPYFVIKF